MTRGDTALVQLIDRALGSEDSAVRNLLNFLGLPQAAPKGLLLTKFNDGALSALYSRDIRACSPTVFDGIDGPYFKQHTNNSPHDTWGRTADINRLLTSHPTFIDGAAEIVCEPVPIEFVADCVLLDPTPAAPARAHIKYQEYLLRQIKPNASNWDVATKTLKTFLDALLP
jgi:hypothetical protein